MCIFIIYLNQYERNEIGKKPYPKQREKNYNHSRCVSTVEDYPPENESQQYFTNRSVEKLYLP